MELVVDFASDKFTHVHPYHLKNSKFRERLIPCELYKDGILPGMARDGVQQTATVRIFRNLIEFSKIIEDEVVEKNGKKFLLSKFFDRRAIALSSKKYLVKHGDAVGYYLTGRVYSVDLFGTNVFPSLIKGVYTQLFKVDPVLHQLRKSFKDGVSIQIEDSSLPADLRNLHFQDLFLEVLQDLKDE